MWISGDYLPDQFRPISTRDFLCELNEDEFGRPYLGPYDQFTPLYHPVFETYLNLSVNEDEVPTTIPRTPPVSTRYPQCVSANECHEIGGQCQLSSSTCACYFPQAYMLHDIIINDILLKNSDRCVYLYTKYTTVNTATWNKVVNS